MKWTRLFFLLFLLPILLYASYDAKDYKKDSEKTAAEWKRHEELIQQFNALNEKEYNLHLLHESIACCERAIVHCNHNDLIECALGHVGLFTPPVQLLKNQWKHFIATHEPEEKFLQISHSGGALHVYNALLSSPKSVRDRIISAAFAPAAIIPEELCFQSHNYISRNDIVTHLDIIGKLRYGSQLQILEPHPDANLWDHDFLSPTFADQKECVIFNYIQNYGSKK